MKMAAVVGCWQLIVHKLHSGVRIAFISLRAKIKTIITEDVLYFIINLDRILTSYFRVHPGIRCFCPPVSPGSPERNQTGFDFLEETQRIQNLKL